MNRQVAHVRHHHAQAGKLAFARAAGKVVAKGFKAVKKVYKKKNKTVKKFQDSLTMDAGHSGITINTIKINDNPKGLKLLKGQSSGGTWRYQQTHKYILTSQTGTQQILDACVVNSGDQCITSSGILYNQSQNAVALQQLNPYLTVTGSLILGAVSTPLNDRFVIKNNSINIEFTNFSPVGALIDVYVLKAKKLGKNWAYTTWTNGLLTDKLSQVNMVPSGPGSATNGTIGGLIPSIVGVKPNAASDFKDFFKICAVKTLTISPASTEQLNIDILINKVVKTSTVREELLSNNIMRSTTYEVMFVSRGALVLDNTTGGSQTPTYGPIKVGCVITAHTQCGAVKGGNANRINLNMGYDNIPVGAVNANISLLNEVDVSVTPGVAA
nr:MAG: capsid protein [Cressdnaviricota sp.]